MYDNIMVFMCVLMFVGWFLIGIFVMLGKLINVMFNIFGEKIFK